MTVRNVSVAQCLGRHVYVIGNEDEDCFHRGFGDKRQKQNQRKDVLFRSAGRDLISSTGVGPTEMRCGRTKLLTACGIQTAKQKTRAR
jgi:hypothetical protein